MRPTRKHTKVPPARRIRCGVRPNNSFALVEAAGAKVRKRVELQNYLALREQETLSTESYETEAALKLVIYNTRAFVRQHALCGRAISSDACLVLSLSSFSLCFVTSTKLEAMVAKYEGRMIPD